MFGVFGSCLGFNCSRGCNCCYGFLLRVVRLPGFRVRHPEARRVSISIVAVVILVVCLAFSGCRVFRFSDNLLPIVEWPATDHCYLASWLSPLVSRFLILDTFHSRLSPLFSRFLILTSPFFTSVLRHLTSYPLQNSPFNS